MAMTDHVIDPVSPVQELSENSVKESSEEVCETFVPLVFLSQLLFPEELTSTLSFSDKRYIMTFPFPHSFFKT